MHVKPMAQASITTSHGDGKGRDNSSSNSNDDKADSCGILVPEMGEQQKVGKWCPIGLGPRRI